MIADAPPGEPTEAANRGVWICAYPEVGGGVMGVSFTKCVGVSTLSDGACEGHCTARTGLPEALSALPGCDRVNAEAALADSVG